MSIGNRIKLLRKKLNLTQKELANKVNVSPQVISNWERGYTTPNADDIANFAKNLDINTQFLYGKTDDPFTFDPAEPYTNSGSLSEINELVEKYGIEQMGFFDIEEWKNLSPEDVRLIEEHFKMIVKLAKERNKKK